MYQRQLQKLNDYIQKLVEDKFIESYEHVPNDILINQIQLSLFTYAQEIDGWAEEVAGNMLSQVANADFSYWNSTSVKIGAGVKKQLKSVVIGGAYRQLQNEQVTLIKTMVLKNAEFVHKWAEQNLPTGQRFDGGVKAILSKMKKDWKRDYAAIRIARTETSRAKANFQQVRAQYIGSTHYIWHCINDGATRHSHAILDGKIFEWTNPPVTDKGKGGVPIRANPGCVFNCRCYAEPILPKRLTGEE